MIGRAKMQKLPDMRIEDALAYVLGQAIQAETQLKKGQKKAQRRDLIDRLNVDGLGDSSESLVSALHQMPPATRTRLLNVKVPSPLPGKVTVGALLRNATGIGGRIVFELESAAKGEPPTEAWDRLRGYTSDYSEAIRDAFYVATDQT